MSKESKLIIAIFLIVFLSSCAATGALIGAGGTLYGLHKEAKAHYPEKVPDLPELPTLPDLPDFLNMFNLNGNNALKKSSQNESTEYGFDCKKQKTSSFTIPPGLDTGTRIRISCEGEPGQRGAGNGDLYMFIELQKDKIFELIKDFFVIAALLLFTMYIVGFFEIRII